ncbi:MAG: hypothetical protein CL867_09535 [Cytophagaceae bacterium]|jgi:hypothetical protein|nr:hypothetical protein [Cytophagaceae bacterium]
MKNDDICSMKQIRFLLTLLGVGLLLVTTTTAAAQNLGSIQRGQRGYTPPPRAIEAGEPEKPDTNLMAQEKAAIYAEALQIDAFKKEVLRSYLEDYYKEKIAVSYNPELKYDEKQPLLNAASKKYEARLAEVFDKDQINQLLAYEEIGVGGDKKERKKKKRKKRKKTKN